MNKRNLILKKILVCVLGYAMIANFITGCKKQTKPIAKKPPAKVNKLVDAADDEELDQLKQLLKDGADINSVDDLGNTPLIVAADNGYVEIVKYLIEQGADPSIKNEFGDTAFDTAFKNRKSFGKLDDEYVEILTFFISKGIKTDDKKKMAVLSKDLEKFSAKKAAQEAEKQKKRSYITYTFKGYNADKNVLNYEMKNSSGKPICTYTGTLKAEYNGQVIYLCGANDLRPDISLPVEGTAHTELSGDKLEEYNGKKLDLTKEADKVKLFFEPKTITFADGSKIKY